MTAAGAEAGRLRVGRPMNAGNSGDGQPNSGSWPPTSRIPAGAGSAGGGQEMTAEAATALTQCRYRASVGNHV
jgi:hypothetical protein